MTSQGVGCLHHVCLSLLGDSEDLALSRMEFHLPQVLPLRKSIKVTLEARSIRQVAHHHVSNGVVSKEADVAFQALSKVIDIQQKQTWPENGALRNT